ncbi:hypothetical protein CVT24_007228 [Panaeolus cyanescens]|uniref:Uncharacterized protein n=1 Tax=Panaeolus cyanescens TaxID=181874 RepID=A0A409YWV2_9AGAR|nr:hypothetical protein CVT24_007228 [Panaeolus cyanescens]
MEWNAPSLGDILSCGWASKHKNTQEEKGKQRLWTIVISESAYLIWKIRCEWRIGKAKDPTKAHTKKEITNRWIATINNRLKRDCLYTNRRRLKKLALDTKVVLHTWKGTLTDEASLPEDWVGAGVLVGIEEKILESHTEVRNSISPGGFYNNQSTK